MEYEVVDGQAKKQKAHKINVEMHHCLEGLCL